MKAIVKAKLALTLALMCTSAVAETFTLDLQNNTPVFEEAECKVYKGKAALTAIYQMVASTRFRLEVVSSVVEEPAFLKLLEEKASYGKSVKVYTNTPLSSYKGIQVHKLGDVQPGSLMINSDSGTIGVGNVRLSQPVQMYSSFFICKDRETFDLMHTAARKYTLDTPK